MDESTFDALLTASAPAGATQGGGISTGIAVLGAETRRIADRRRRRLRLTLVPAAVVAVSLAGIGVVGAINAHNRPDFIIPITYTTDTGRVVHCEHDVWTPKVAGLEQGSTVADWFESQDWTGIGQEIYALATERIATHFPTLYDTAGDTLDHHGPVDNSERTIEQRAWNGAESKVIIDRFDAAPGIANTLNTAVVESSTCTGEMH